jgi:hypothetical protein
MEAEFFFPLFDSKLNLKILIEIDFHKIDVLSSNFFHLKLLRQK